MYPHLEFTYVGMPRVYPHLEFTYVGMPRVYPHLEFAYLGLRRVVPHLNFAYLGLRRVVPHLEFTYVGMPRVYPHLEFACLGFARVSPHVRMDSLGFSAVCAVALGRPSNGSFRRCATRDRGSNLFVRRGESFLGAPTFNGHGGQPDAREVCVMTNPVDSRVSVPVDLCDALDRVRPMMAKLCKAELLRVNLDPWAAVALALTQAEAVYRTVTRTQEQLPVILDEGFEVRARMVEEANVLVHWGMLEDDSCAWVVYSQPARCDQGRENRGSP